MHIDEIIRRPIMHIDKLIRSAVGADYELYRNTQGYRKRGRHIRRARFIVATADLSAPRAPSTIQVKNLQSMIGPRWML
jgi:hypothetical protein